MVVYTTFMVVYNLAPLYELRDGEMALKIFIGPLPTRPGVFVSSYLYIQASLRARHISELGVRLSVPPPQGRHASAQSSGLASPSGSIARLRPLQQSHHPRQVR